MMLDYPPEVWKLADETDPWREFDPATERFYIRDDAPQDIKDKYKRLMKILNDLITSCQEAGWM